MRRWIPVSEGKYLSGFDRQSPRAHVFEMAFLLSDLCLSARVFGPLSEGRRGDERESSETRPH